MLFSVSKSGSKHPALQGLRKHGNFHDVKTVQRLRDRCTSSARLQNGDKELSNLREHAPNQVCCLLSQWRKVLEMAIPDSRRANVQVLHPPALLGVYAKEPLAGMVEPLPLFDISLSCAKSRDLRECNVRVA